MIRVGRVYGCCAALLLLLAFAPIAGAHDHNRLAEINRNADALLETLKSDAAGIAPTLDAARKLLDEAGVKPARQPSEPVTRSAEAGESAAAAAEFDTVLFAPLLQQVALETGNLGHRELMEAAAPSGGQALLLKRGSFTLGGLADALAGNGGVLAASDSGYRLALPLFISEDAALAMSDGDRLEMATERGVFIINEGLLTIRDAEVTGTDAAPRVIDFHPFILTVRGGRAEIEDSRFSGLGYDGQPLMSGVSFASSRFAGKRSSGRVTGNILKNIRSVEVTGVADFSFSENRLDGARGIGLRLERVDQGVISDNLIVASGQHGLLMIGGKNTVVSGNVMAENAGRGIFARDGVGHATIADNVLLANGVEGISVAGGACVDIFSNAALRNRADGIRVAQSLGVRISGNLLARNQGAGIAVADAISPDDETEITDNIFLANVSGISAERFSRLLLRQNDLSNQLPVLFAGALQYETPRYLTFLRTLDKASDAGFRISADASAPPSLFRGNGGQFRLSDFTGCHPGEGE
ncbi:right-handed parallel beta-helix repeat-containing protein [Martelella mediterranea]|uniref:right-handed parallel beta-helix repeat-containing protein n=1 Tax=Martelella mediterranea TaxID=293089 RepID=UPI001E463E3C|nr:right-handed parallel beta-helix repeat-containing protein [Martelella mediterranea]MCD1636868.1 right-handed parallel beta-helix repeat-containing protein [Martelella mediterranea]